jgi:hypothetical protein
MLMPLAAHSSPRRVKGSRSSLDGKAHSEFSFWLLMLS